MKWRAVSSYAGTVRLSLGLNLRACPVSKHGRFAFGSRFPRRRAAFRPACGGGGGPVDPCAVPIPRLSARSRLGLRPASLRPCLDSSPRAGSTHRPPTPTPTPIVWVQPPADDRNSETRFLGWPGSRQPTRAPRRRFSEPELARRISRIRDLLIARPGPGGRRPWRPRRYGRHRLRPRRSWRCRTISPARADDRRCRTAIDDLIDHRATMMAPALVPNRDPRRASRGIIGDRRRRGPSASHSASSSAFNSVIIAGAINSNGNDLGLQQPSRNDLGAGAATCRSRSVGRCSRFPPAPHRRSPVPTSRRRAGSPRIVCCSRPRRFSMRSAAWHHGRRQRSRPGMASPAAAHPRRCRCGGQRQRWACTRLARGAGALGKYRRAGHSMRAATPSRLAVAAGRGRPAAATALDDSAASWVNVAALPLSPFGARGACARGARVALSPDTKLGFTPMPKVRTAGDADAESRRRRLPARPATLATRLRGRNSPRRQRRPRLGDGPNGCGAPSACSTWVGRRVVRHYRARRA